ncbi:hypothetical protein Chor_010222, partial [Crotalus horridus]
DVQKERETHNYLTKETIKEKVQIYNSDVTDKLKMTLNASGIYTGFIKVQIELYRPITLQTSVNVGKHLNSNETTFYLPNGYMNTLHISSTNTVREVIEALLKKFLVADNPAKFALYKQCHKEDQEGVTGAYVVSKTSSSNFIFGWCCEQVPKTPENLIEKEGDLSEEELKKKTPLRILQDIYTCKLLETEHPLYLRLVAGPRTDTLSFVLREHESGEVLWEAFSLPELQNFLRILDKEEDEQLQTLKRRYAVYREKLEEALRGVWIPS